MSEEEKCPYEECGRPIERGKAVVVYLGEEEIHFCSPGCRDMMAVTLRVNFSPVRPDKKSGELRVYERERRV